MNKKIILTTAVIFCYGITNAQQSAYYEKVNYHFDHAKDLFQTKIYAASQYEYNHTDKRYLTNMQKEASRFFDNMIAVILQRNHAEEGLEEFMIDFPHSAYIAQANLPLADYYLAKKDFERALEILRKINPEQLSGQDETQYVLKRGYAEFMTGNTRSAIRSLEEVYNRVDEREQLAYMLGHLYYTERDNENAFTYFDTIKENPEYKDLVQPYYVQMYFNDGEYDRAIAEGEAILNANTNQDLHAEFHKIIGESYFMKKDYNNAYPHLKEYIQKDETPSDSDLYEMGFVSAQLGEYQEAVSYYNQLINSQSSISQNAYYQLGNAYLHVGQKQEALSAFRSSYQMDYDENVQKLAHEQYAKLSYDIGNPYESSSKVIQSYLEKYPNDANYQEMQSLLVKSYVYSGNFKETLQAIDEWSTKDPEVQKIDQEVSYLLGIEEFNKGNYTAAETYFNRSLVYNYNKEFHYRATYWLAQTYYRQGDYQSAIARYQSLEKAPNFLEKSQLSYDLGYAYFKAEQFAEAKKEFQKYLKNPNSDYKADAELRLADTYYAENDLDKAIAIYDEAQSTEDYTLFQKAMALGFQGNNAQKIITLQDLIKRYPDSDYQDDAYYEIGVAYATQSEFSKANENFAKVIKNSSDKDLIAQAEIYQAQNEIDLGKPDKALAQLIQLGTKYMNTAYAPKIVQAARPIFLEKGDIEGYKQFANQLGQKIDASEIDDLHLSLGNKLYAEKKYKEAIPHYNDYLAQNPTGEGLFQAKYQLGESYYQTQDETKAILVLEEVANVQNDYQEDAQTRIAQVFIKQNKYNEAKPYLVKMSTAQNVSIQSFANVELMNLYLRENDLDNAQLYADKILANSKNNASTLENAKVVKARILMNKGKNNEAKKAYEALEKSTNVAVAAEALYAKAYYQNLAKSYKSSNETIFKLANNYASEEYWGARALVVMAKNYMGLKDKYQTSYTLDQIIENYQDFPDVVMEAKELKKKLK